MTGQAHSAGAMRHRGSEVHEGVVEEHRGGDGQQRRVEAVEHAAVARQDVAAVLDAQLPLQQALHEVAPRAEHADHDAQSHPLPELEQVGTRHVQQPRHDKAEHAAANAPHPRLLGRNAFEKAGRKALVKQAATHVGSRVRRPEEQENGEGKSAFIHHLARKGVVAEGQHRKHAETDAYVQLDGKGVGPVFQRVGLLQVKLAHGQIDECEQIGYEGIRGEETLERHPLWK